MLSVETRHLPAPEAARRLDTAELRCAFALEGLFRPGEIALVCTHLDRMIVGGAVPGGEPLELAHVAETGTPGFLDRREAVIVALDAGGSVHAAGQAYTMAAMDMLYLGPGSGPLRFAGQGVRFYGLSAPAHRAPEDALLAEADRVSWGRGSEGGRAPARHAGGTPAV